MSRKSYNDGFKDGLESDKRAYAGRELKTAEGLKHIEGKIDEMGKMQDSTHDLIDGVCDILAEESNKNTFGILPRKLPNEMGETEQKVLLSCLYTLIARYGATEDQSSYYSAIERHIGKTCRQSDFRFEGLSSLDSISDRRTIFRCICEFLILNQGRVVYPDGGEASYLNSMLPINETDIIRSEAENEYGNLGLEALVDKYLPSKNPGVSEIGERLNAAKDAPSGWEETERRFKEAPESFETVEIGSMLNITERTYSSCKIVIDSKVNCSSKLELINCVVVFNKGGNSACITLESDAELSASGCVFRCVDVNPYGRISGEKDSTARARFENCSFTDCGGFISNMPNVEFKGGGIRGWNEKFVASVNNLDIDGLRISIDSIETDDKPCRECRYMFDNNSGTVTTVKNVRAVGSNLDFSKIAGKYGLFRIKGFVSDSSFSGLTDCVEGDNIAFCEFTKCSHAVNAPNGADIKNCKFNECGGQLITGAAKGLKIRNCEFDAWNGSYLGNSQLAMIEITAKEIPDKDSRALISGCIFKGNMPAEKYIIAVNFVPSRKSGDNPAVEVKHCDFIDCVTCRKDGELIRTRSPYSNGKYTYTVFVDKSCRGTRHNDYYDEDNGYKSEDVATAIFANLIPVVGPFISANMIKEMNEEKKERRKIHAEREGHKE